MRSSSADIPAGYGGVVARLQRPVPDGAYCRRADDHGQDDHLTDPSGLRIAFRSGVLAMPTPDTAPVLDSQPITVAAAGLAYQYQVAAHDLNSVALSYLLAAVPGMTINAQTGLSPGRPTAAARPRPIIVEVYNARAAPTPSSNSPSSVSGVNARRVRHAGRHDQWPRKVSMQIAVHATDADGDPLVYWADNCPPAPFSMPAATLTWTPGPDQAGITRTWARSRQRRHPPGECDDDAVDRGGQPAPDPGRVADRTVLEGRPSTSPCRRPTSTATGSRSPAVPAGRGLPRPEHRRLRLDAALRQHGVYAIPFTVSDGTHAVTETTTITVLNVNAAPQFDDLDSAGGRGSGSALPRLRLDPNNPGFQPPNPAADGTLSTLLGTAPTVTYTVSGLPAGAEPRPANGDLRWPTGLSDAGTYIVTFTATNDGDGTGSCRYATVTVPITVQANGGHVPVFVQLHLFSDR